VIQTRAARALKGGAGLAGGLLGRLAQLCQLGHQAALRVPVLAPGGRVCGLLVGLALSIALMVRIPHPRAAGEQGRQYHGREYLHANHTPGPV